MGLKRFALLATLTAAVSWADNEAGKPALDFGSVLVWSDAETDVLGAPSPDGRFLSFVDRSGNLSIRDLDSGTNRAITRPAGENAIGQFAYFSIFSPDGNQIAYAWFNEEGFYELRLADVATAETRLIYRNPEAGFVQPCTFSPDGEHILTLFFRRDNVSQIALVSVGDGSVQTLRSLDWFYPKKIDLSPDGHFAVYDSMTGEDSPAREILVIALDGSSETALTNHPANDLAPLWTPDGSAVVFASDRRGSMDLWMVPVDEGRIAGQAALVEPDLGRALPMAFTRDGRLFYGLRTGRTETYVAGIDLASGTLTEEPIPAGSSYQGANRGPEWSPDGRFLAFLTRVGTENFGQEHRAVTILELATSRESVAWPRLAHIERLRWSPDSASMLLSGIDIQGRAGLFTMAVPEGTVQQAVVERGGSFRGIEGDWSVDGGSIYFVQQGEQGGSIIHSHDLLTGQRKAVYRPTEPARIYALRRARGRDALAFALSASGGQRQSLVVLEPGAKDAEEILHLQYGRLTGIDWNVDDEGLLVSTDAASGPALWSVSLGAADPRRLDAPWMQSGPVRISADGTRAAFSQGGRKSEVRAIEMHTVAAR